MGKSMAGEQKEKRKGIPGVCPTVQITMVLTELSFNAIEYTNYKHVSHPHSMDLCRPSPGVKGVSLGRGKK